MSNNFASGSSLLIQIQIAIVGIIIVLGIFFIWRTVSRMEQRLKVVEINQKTLAQCQNMSANCLNTSDENPISCPMTSSATRDPNIQTYSTAVPREFKDIDEFSDEMLKVFGNDDEDYEDEEDYEEDSEYNKKATTTAKNIIITPIETITKTVPVVLPTPSSEQIKVPAVPVVPVVPVVPAVPVVPVQVVSVDAAAPVAQVVVNSVYVSTSSNSVNLVDDVLTETESESGNPLSKSKLKAMSIEKLKSICTHHNLSTEGSKNTLVARILGESRD